MDPDTVPSAELNALSEAQQLNLETLETTLHEQWGLGERILLCWAPSHAGVDVLWAPHYFLGNFTASMNEDNPADRLEALNGSFLRKLISGLRQMTEEELESTARRFGLSVEPVPLPVPLSADTAIARAVETLVKRYSISYVENRAALLLDIVDFSLFTPFEQTSQLNSLSYSLNASYSKLQERHPAIDVARTTTGDGFYLWNRDASPMGSVDLFLFMVMVIADNAIARRKAKGNTVPAIRTGFHMGGHYEFSQAQGVNPTLFSYIVGDVTIELARMVESAKSGQILIGDFHTRVPTSQNESAYLVDVDTERFVDRARKSLRTLQGLRLAGEPIERIHCYLSGETGASGGESVRRYTVTDKHHRSRDVYNLMINIQVEGQEPIILGVHGVNASVEFGRGSQLVPASRPGGRNGM